MLKEITHIRTGRKAKDLTTNTTKSYKYINEAKRAMRTKVAATVKDKEPIKIEAKHRPSLVFTKFGVCGIMTKPIKC